jgi:DNA repair photolyase
MNKSKIEWTDFTWNPVTGCTKISEGCKNCYAERIAKRFWDHPFSEVRLHPERLKELDGQIWDQMPEVK